MHIPIRHDYDKPTSKIAAVIKKQQSGIEAMPDLAVLPEGK